MREWEMDMNGHDKCMSHYVVRIPFSGHGTGLKPRFLPPGEAPDILSSHMLFSTNLRYALRHVLEDIEYAVIIRYGCSRSCTPYLYGVSPVVIMKKDSRKRKRKKKWKYPGIQLVELAKNPLTNFRPYNIFYDIGDTQALSQGPGSGGRPEEIETEMRVTFIRRGELKDPLIDTSPSCTLRAFSELGLYALMSGYDRMGTSAKLMVFQTALWREILTEAIKRLEVGQGRRDHMQELLDALSPYYDNGGEGLGSGGAASEEIAGGDAFLALLGLARYLVTARAYYRSMAAIGTTAVWVPKTLADVKEMHDEVSSIVMKIVSDSDEECEATPPSRLYELLHHDGGAMSSLGRVLLGRVLRRVDTSASLARHQHLVDTGDNSVVLLIDWSEQMGPVDAGISLLTLLRILSERRGQQLSIKELNQKIKKVVLTATPLSLTHAFTGLYYLKKVLKLRDGEQLSIVLTSASDPVVPKAVIKEIYNKEARRKCGNIIYFAGGPTYHTLKLSYELRKLERSLNRAGKPCRVLIIPPTMVR